MLRKVSWGVMTLLAALVAAYAVGNALVPTVRGGFVEELFAAKALRSFGHMAAGGVALAVGALQFSTRLRVRRPVVHRSLGKTYVAMVVVGGVSAFLLAPSSTGGVTAHFGFGILAVLWVTSALVAVARVRAGDYDGHRAWMIRSYSRCLAAVTLRIYLPISAVAGIPFEEAYPAISWLCWVPNLVVAEWLLVRSSIVPVDATA